MVPVEVFGVQIEAGSGSPLVLLREIAGSGRVLPIFVGEPEAFAIAIGLQGLSAQRPLTHDLLADVMAQTDTRLEDVTVTELRNGTFFAELHLQGPGGPRVVSSRPSDAIALAVRLNAPVFAAEDVLDEAGALWRIVESDELVEQDELDQQDPSADRFAAPTTEEIDEEVAAFRDLLDDLQPGDFGDGRDLN